MELKTVNETEVHRQHVRLKIPIGIEIDGVRHVVDDWSIGGFGMEAERFAHKVGERFPTRLIFPFEDYEVTIETECETIYNEPEPRRVGCRFVSLSQGQLDLFRHIVDTYLSGELIDAGRLLKLVSNGYGTRVARENFKSQLNADPESNWQRVLRGGTIGLVATASLGLLGLLYLGLEQRFFGNQLHTAVIEAPLFKIRAPISGLVAPVENRPLIRAGMDIATIRGADGQNVPIASPCECVILDWLVGTGQIARFGEVIAILAAGDQPLMVRAGMDTDRAGQLREGDLAEIHFPGRQEVMRGQIEKIDYKPTLSAVREDNLTALGSTPMVQIYIRPDRPFDFDDFGTLVEIEFL